MFRSSSRHQSFLADAPENIIDVTRFQNDRRVVRLITVVGADVFIDPRATRAREWNEQTDAAVKFHAKIPFGFLFRGRTTGDRKRTMRTHQSSKEKNARNTL